MYQPARHSEGMVKTAKQMAKNTNPPMGFAPTPVFLIFKYCRAFNSNTDKVLKNGLYSP